MGHDVFPINSAKGRELLGDEYVDQFIIVEFLDRELDRIVAEMKGIPWYKVKRHNLLSQRNDILWALWVRESTKLQKISFKQSHPLHTRPTFEDDDYSETE